MTVTNMLFYILPVIKEKNKTMYYEKHVITYNIHVIADCI